MADYAPVQESELETGPEPSAGVVGNGQGDLGGFQPVNDNDIIPAGGPAGPTGEFAYKGIPAAAAKRFSQSNPLANILGTAASKFSDNFVNNFTSLNDADMKILVENGYGDYSGPGALLQHAADAFNSGATLLKNGIMAGISSIAPTAGAVAGQTVKEAGGSQTEADRAEREFNFDTMAALSDVGAQHGMAMEGAAKAASPEAAAAAAAKAAADEAKQVATAQAQAAAPGIWGHAYRVDGTPDGDLVQTPLGRLPSATEAASQAQTVADALHLPPETADVIHKTYVQTGRPPAEVLMDAQTNHGGVLSDLVAGKVPDVYQPPAGTTPPAAPKAPEPTPITREQFERMDIDKLDRAAFGHAGGDIVDIPPDQLRVQPGFESDAENARDKFAKGGMDWAQSVKYDEPLFASIDQDGKFNLEDGHHRRLAAIKTGRPTVPVEIEIKGKPIEALLKRQEEQGPLDPETLQPFPKQQAAPPSAPTLTPEQGVSNIAPAAGTGVSKIGQSIEQKAIDAGITDGFLQTAGYDVKTVKGQTALVSDLVTNNPDKMNAIVNGEEPIPHGMDPSMFITGVEEYIKQTKDWDLASRLANSPVVTKTSEAAQTLRFAQERTPDSATAILRDIQQANEKAAGGPKVVAKNRAQAKAALKESNGVFLPKEDLRWEKFLDEIKC